MTTQTKNIKQHETEYWHIPKTAILPIIGAILFLLLAIGNIYLIDKEVVKTAFTCEKDSCNLIPRDLINIYPIIGEYILISLFLISIVASFKRGYKNLKSYDEEGLIKGLIVGLIVGLILVLIVALIFVLIVGLTSELIVALIFVLIVGLIVALILVLIFELIFVLIVGLTEEFD